VFWLEIVKNSKLDLYVSVMVEVNTGNQWRCIKLVLISILIYIFCDFVYFHFYFYQHVFAEVSLINLVGIVRM
jgi:hypothetical protein